MRDASYGCGVTPVMAEVPDRLGALRFSILNWSAWSPDRETRAAWRQWATGAADQLDDASVPPILPMLLRRRLSPFGQRVVGAISACAEGLPSARYILSTRHGEFARAVATLDAIDANELPSPTDFSMSIHHALLGLLSIHTGNRLGHTALSGGDSFAGGLLEAATCVAERPEEPVILVYGDMGLPQEYAAFREADDTELPFVVAFALGLPSGAPGSDVAIEYVPNVQASQNYVASPGTSLAAEFLAFFLSGASQVRAVGRRSQWVWRRAP